MTGKKKKKKKIPLPDRVCFSVASSMRKLTSSLHQMMIHDNFDNIAPVPRFGRMMRNHGNTTRQTFNNIIFIKNVYILNKPQ